ncbi:GDP-perosamine N-acetyltransferase [Acinetobacter sp. KAM398]|uniref:acetyltransferase n=1 Tax=unclassified Acinetobacter TaxID=196816 RepID=UPI001F1A870C|nr:MULTISPECIES: acetyltransferase [unclassified Acinetobacter]GJC31970.1 GDP-perosamine N-acetyltransferase [Acinetobacter sp. KAM392]GJC34755.1 GDP-perosamine N-acetyltransferase [Acinetobacter sp. KAM393]GJC37566.1 GDP-perosamine N-acetyltransferase [Acinetobacter sp. KAM394]GJC40403.1 GDP-perosamine N-acetyltransferase [Acinetobacter sp. KAM395]GJC43289.1 GDP-perosamine N-acetyltransferase [Acinetobacter sp. KAM396]
MISYIGVYGASGFGKEVMPLARQQYPTLEKQQFVFIDDSGAGTRLNGYQVLSYEDFLKYPDQKKAVTIAIANSQVREKLVKRLTEDQIQHLNIQASNTVILDEVQIGEGSLLCPFTCLTSNIKIGKFFHANIYSYVAHDCVIGDYVTFAPGVKCNGNIHIHDHAYIGTGAVIKQGTPDQPLVIGKGAVVGMGAVVTKSVPPSVTVIGNPARILEKK